ncbi:SDR family NAD(P)-dependent oxidoreductase [Nocardia sp. NPDC056611]|uniref:SDR family NAD(P)-dependent oxidoreductase n=1 Tax=Nocardia sp. NPDC056611 TaxID=3345877 RepID=UPI00366A7DBA
MKTESAKPAPWKRALVTGASAGIGSAFARDLAARGVDVVLVARDKSRLEELAEELKTRHAIDVEVLPADLAEEGSLEAVERRLSAEPFVDLLVNNAGVGTFGAFTATDIAAEIQTVGVNVLAPLRLTRRAIQKMHARGSGAIIAVSSMDALQPTPYHSVYGASKAFVNSLFEAIHEEARSTPITITTVMPGYVQTEFTKTAGVDGALDRVPRPLILTPERVAAESLDGAADGRAMVVPGRMYKISAALLRVLPRSLGRRLFATLAPQR